MMTRVGRRLALWLNSELPPCDNLDHSKTTRQTTEYSHKRSIRNQAPHRVCDKLHPERSSYIIVFAPQSIVDRSGVEETRLGMQGLSNCTEGIFTPVHRIGKV